MTSPNVAALGSVLKAEQQASLMDWMQEKKRRSRLQGLGLKQLEAGAATHQEETGRSGLGQ